MGSGLGGIGVNRSGVGFTGCEDSGPITMTREGVVPAAGLGGMGLGDRCAGVGPGDGFAGNGLGDTLAGAGRGEGRAGTGLGEVLPGVAPAAAGARPADGFGSSRGVPATVQTIGPGRVRVFPATRTSSAGRASCWASPKRGTGVEREALAGRLLERLAGCAVRQPPSATRATAKAPA